MTLVSKNSDYAIRALMALAQKPGRGFVSSSALAGADGIPLRFLRRILRDLLRAKMIEAKEGVRGGVRLARRPEKITVANIIQLFQGPVQLSRCMFRSRLCGNRSSCVLRRRIKGIEAIVSREFQGITIAGLCQDQPRRKKRGIHEA